MKMSEYLEQQQKLDELKKQLKEEKTNLKKLKGDSYFNVNHVKNFVKNYKDVLLIAVILLMGVYIIFNNFSGATVTDYSDPIIDDSGSKDANDTTSVDEVEVVETNETEETVGENETKKGPSFKIVLENEEGVNLNNGYVELEGGDKYLYKTTIENLESAAIYCDSDYTVNVETTERYDDNFNVKPLETKEILRFIKGEGEKDIAYVFKCNFAGNEVMTEKLVSFKIKLIPLE